MPLNQDPSLLEVAESISPFDPGEVLARVGGLSLTPENAGKLFRLEALANISASISEGTSGKPAPSRPRLESILNGGTLAAQAAVAEDPFDNCFVEAITFFGGSYLVFPGIVSQSSYTLRRLMEAIFGGGDADWPPQHYAEGAYESIRALLAVTDAMLRRAGLDRKTEASTTSRDGVVLPAAAEFQRLRAAVTFQFDELAELLAPHGLTVDALAPFICKDGDGPFPETDWEEGPLALRPLFQTVDGLIVCGVPGQILPAMRHFAVTSARQMRVLAKLADRYTMASWANVCECLERLRFRRLGFRMGPGTPESQQEGFFAFDTDKMAFVQLATDPLTDYGEQVFGSWNSGDLANRLIGRAKEAEEFAYAIDPAPNELFHILLFDSPGRSLITGIPANHGLRSRFISMSAEDFDCIAQLEVGEPLVLWQFASAAEAIRAQTRITAFGELDEFEMWRKHRSHYWSDDKRPDMITIVPGTGVEIRRSIHRRQDKHGVPSSDMRETIDVVRLEEGNVPVYASRESMPEKLSFLVEGLPRPVWIQGPADLAQEHRSAYWQVAEMLAYWVWQATDVVRNPLNAVVTPAIVINITLEDVSKWVGPSHEVLEQLPPTGPSVSYSVAPSRIDLTLHRRFIREAYGADNAGERKLVGAILESISQLAVQHGNGSVVSWTSDEIETMVDEIAPLGLKKKLLILNTALNPEIDPIGIPPYRAVQEADRERLVDELGQFLSQTVRLGRGPIADERRTSVLQAVVRFYFERLQKEISTFSRDSMLKWLVAHNDAIVREVAHGRLTTPTRLECYGREQEYMERLQKEIPLLNTTGLAARFLIEYVAACPPNGIRPMSKTAYDNLMAIASEIVNRATESDLIRWGIADLKLEMLPSGRLGVAREDYLSRTGRFHAEYLATDVEKAYVNFARTWRSRPASTDAPSDDVVEIDAAFMAEFSCTLTEISEFLGEVMNLGTEQPRAEKSMPLDEFVGRLSTSLGWEPSKTEAVVKLFSLQERENFLKPPAPYRLEDVYPWRFNRQLSLMRRPIVSVTGSERAVVYWGNRQVSASGAYLFETFWSGRLKASTDEMKRMISKIRQGDTNAFAHEVASCFFGQGDYLVKEKFKKVKGRVLGYPVNLGDVDVLVADENRRRLLLIEAKDLGQARTPFELSSELQELLLGGENEPSMVERHSRRLSWVKEHLEDVLETLRLAPGDWTVDAVLVVDEDLMTPYLHSDKPELPILSLRRLRSEFIANWSGRPN